MRDLQKMKDTIDMEDTMDMDMDKELPQPELQRQTLTPISIVTSSPSPSPSQNDVAGGFLAMARQLIDQGQPSQALHAVISSLLFPLLSLSWMLDYCVDYDLLLIFLETL